MFPRRLLTPILCQDLTPSNLSSQKAVSSDRATESLELFSPQLALPDPRAYSRSAISLLINLSLMRPSAFKIMMICAAKKTASEGPSAVSWNLQERLARAATFRNFMPLPPLAGATKGHHS